MTTGGMIQLNPIYLVGFIGLKINSFIAPVQVHHLHPPQKVNPCIKSSENYLFQV